MEDNRDLELPAHWDQRTDVNPTIQERDKEMDTVTQRETTG